MSEAIQIAGKTAPAGKTTYLEIPVARLVTGDWMSLPVAVIHGSQPGPRIGLSAAIHGDELNGMEIIRRVLKKLDPEKLCGSVIAVPVVNVFGFLERDRYLPDRRDLNRSFPGSPRGSLAARLAHLFLTGIVEQCEVVLDYHTGSLHRTNLPQIRADLSSFEIRQLAEAFGAPLLYKVPPIKGSLRWAAQRAGISLLVFEGGEPLRLEESVIAAGVAGTFRVLGSLGVCEIGPKGPTPVGFEARGARWIRASRSGILQLEVELGQRVQAGDMLGEIYSDFFTSKSKPIRAPNAGLVMGFTNNPLVNQGDALLHLALSRTEARDAP